MAAPFSTIVEIRGLSMGKFGDSWSTIAALPVQSTCIMEPQGDAQWRERLCRALSELKANQEEGVLRQERPRVAPADVSPESTAGE